MYITTAAYRKEILSKLRDPERILQSKIRMVDASQLLMSKRVITKKYVNHSLNDCKIVNKPAKPIIFLQIAHYLGYIFKLN